MLLASCGQAEPEGPPPDPVVVPATDVELACAAEQFAAVRGRLTVAFDMRPMWPAQPERRARQVRDLRLYLLLTGPTEPSEPTGDAHLLELDHWLSASAWAAPEQDALMGWARAIGHGHARFERDPELVERARAALRLVAPRHGLAWLHEWCPPREGAVTLDSILGLEPGDESWLEPRDPRLQVRPESTPLCYENSIRARLLPPARTRGESWVVGPIDLEPLEEMRGAYFSDYVHAWVSFSRHQRVRQPRPGDVAATRRMLAYFTPAEGDSPHRRLYVALGNASRLTPPAPETPTSPDAVGPLGARHVSVMLGGLGIYRTSSQPDHLERYESYLAQLRDAVREPRSERRRLAALANAHVDRMLEDHAQHSRRSEFGRRVDLSFNAMHERLLRGPIQAFEALR